VAERLDEGKVWRFVQNMIDFLLTRPNVLNPVAPKIEF
jgi:hypothetical protein